MGKNELEETKQYLEYPKLREGVEPVPFVYQGQQCILLKDQLGYSDRSILLSPILIPILSKMDGRNSIKDLQIYFMQTTGQFIMREKLERLIAELDESLFLESERYKEVKKRQVEEFLKSSLRKPTYAGKSYPLEKDKLKEMIESFFEAEDKDLKALESKKNDKKVVGLIAPHIDLNLGGKVYASGYKMLLESQIPDTWIILGTSHGILENFFTLTYKDFETPFGILSTHKDLVSTIKEKVSYDLFKDEFSHKNEHTIEFQTIFMSYFWPNSKIVPILCYFDTELTDEDKKKIDEMIKVLKEIITQNDVGIIASVDFAHVGPRYGDRFVPNTSIVQTNLDMDKLLLDLLANTDGDRFFDIIKNENNKRKICGFAPLYVFSKVLEGFAYGELTAHSYGYMDEQNSFVTFASMVFYKK